MTTLDELAPPASDEKYEKPAGGPTAPIVLNDKKHEGFKAGEYDDHSPDRTSSNEKQIARG